MLIRVPSNLAWNKLLYHLSLYESPFVSFIRQSPSSRIANENTRRGGGYFHWYAVVNEVRNLLLQSITQLSVAS